MKRSFNMKRTGTALAAVLLGLLLAGGCQTAGKKPIHAGGSKPDVSVKLEPGDLIEIKFFYAPELNDIQRVRPDGKLSLQLIGEVDAQGQEPAALQAELKKRYDGLIEKPEVSVVVREMSNRAVFIGGAVRNPGRVPMPGTITALGAIVQAGGFDMTQAGYHNVVVIRSSEGQPSAYVLDFSGDLKGHPSEPFYLHSQDIVHVPKTKIANVNQWIDQYLNKVVPQFGLTYYRPLGDGTIGLDTSSR